MPLTFVESQLHVARLVKQFRTNLNHYRAPNYKEAQARQDLIDPLFEALGWDVHNRQGVAPAYKEVLVEESLDIEGHQKAADHTLLQRQIDATDRQIDALVYQLYGLTDDEIKIVEGRA